MGTGRNQLKRRADLIPNLVNTVQGFASQEKEVLIGVTEARSRLETAASPEEAAEANAQLTNALSRLNVVVERYPELKSNENFIRLRMSWQVPRIGSLWREGITMNRPYLQQQNKKVPHQHPSQYVWFYGKEYFEVGEEDQEVPK